MHFFRSEQTGRKQYIVPGLPRVANHRQAGDIYCSRLILGLLTIGNKAQDQQQNDGTDRGREELAERSPG